MALLAACSMFSEIARIQNHYNYCPGSAQSAVGNATGCLLRGNSLFVFQALPMKFEPGLEKTIVDNYFMAYAAVHLHTMSIFINAGLPELFCNFSLSGRATLEIAGRS